MVVGMPPPERHCQMKFYHFDGENDVGNENIVEKENKAMALINSIDPKRARCFVLSFCFVFLSIALLIPNIYMPPPPSDPDAVSLLA